VRTSDHATICRMIARLAKEQWELRNQAEAAERARKAKEKRDGR